MTNKRVAIFVHIRHLLQHLAGETYHVLARYRSSHICLKPDKGLYTGDSEETKDHRSRDE
jgi:hypothetical protein